MGDQDQIVEGEESRPRVIDDTAGDGDVVALQPPASESPLSEEMVRVFGASFNPQPFGYLVTRGEFMGKPCLWLTFEHAHGRISFPLDDNEAQGMSNRLEQQSRGGLVVAKDIPSGAPFQL